MIGRTLAAALVALVTVSASMSADAQPYPSKPIRFIVPFPAGGSTDVGARLIGEYLSRAFGQQVYVENKTGANGTIGIESAAKSTPDGFFASAKWWRATAVSSGGNCTSQSSCRPKTTRSLL